MAREGRGTPNRYLINILLTLGRMALGFLSGYSPNLPTLRVLSRYFAAAKIKYITSPSPQPIRTIKFNNQYRKFGDKILLRAVKTLKVVAPPPHTFLCDVLHRLKYRFKFITGVCGEQVKNWQCGSVNLLW